MSDDRAVDERIVAAVGKGAWADFSPDRPIVQAAVLAELCLNRDPDAQPRGVRLRGLTISGDLDLEAMRAPFPIILIDCRLELSQFLLTGARLARLDLRGSTITTGIGALDIVVDGDVLFDSTEVEGGLDLRYATIRGRLWGRNALLKNPGDVALDLEHATVEGPVVLNSGFTAEGRVRFTAAHIGGQLNLTGATVNGDRSAIEAQGVVVGGSLFMSRDLSTQEAAHCRGEVALDGASVGGELNCTGAVLAGPNEGRSLTAQNLRVQGNVFLNDRFRADGSVVLSGAVVGGQLNVGHACLGGPFVLDTAEIGSHLYLNDRLEALGELRLWAATVKGNVDARDGIFHGPVDATGLSVGGRLDVNDARFDHRVHLVRAQAAQLADRGTRWPAELFLDGFEYRSIVEDQRSWQERKELIERQGYYSAHPYRQLAAVYRAAGLDVAARQVAMASEAARAKSIRSRPRKLWLQFMRWTVGYGYQPARIIVWAVVLVVLATLAYDHAIGRNRLLPTSEALREEVRSSRCERRYPCVNPVAYSVDVVVPIIDLHEREEWEPDRTTTEGRWVAALTWVLAGLGWLLATLLVAAVGGFIRRD
ncbi:MAG: hypothetical protein M3N68_14625 [Actinomycetota bacterium]|nr:hypothetical protein [Actinomycetota bacterium]